jgi:tetratricopeptide (TPR) repeat protein
VLTGDPRLNGAREALVRRDFVTALQRAEAARKQGVPLPDLLEFKADLFKETNYLDKEVATLRQWTAAAPRDHHPWLKLFHIYLDLGWRHEAGKASDRVLQLAPNDPRSLVTRALLYYRSKDPTLGLASIEAAERLNPANREFVSLHATILLKALRFAEAEAEMRRSLTQDLSRSADRLVLAQALLGQRKLVEAAAALRQVQQQEPDSAEAAYGLGIIAQKQGDLPEATRQFQRAAARDAQYSNVLWQLGRLYIQQGRGEEGRKMVRMYETLDANASAFETALSRLESRPDNADLHAQLAQSHLGADELPQAIVEFRRVLELRPNDARARQGLITALTRHGRVTEARRLASPSSQRGGT